MWWPYRAHQKIVNTLILNRKIIITSDGSSSIFLEELQETYHSVFGAIQEANHVYLKEGFSQMTLSEFNILEMGFGTGLNAFLTALEAQKQHKKVRYHAVEGFPITQEEVAVLNYPDQVDDSNAVRCFNQLHQIDWEVELEINDSFRLKKMKALFEEVQLESGCYDLIYFDAFGYPYQPELWSELIFKKMYDALAPQGILVTYACRGPIKVAMRNVGFRVERLPGPPGKRQMIRAHKKSK